MKEQIKKQISKAIAKLYPDHKDLAFSVDYAPSNIDADFASNVALILGKRLKKKPMDIANEIFLRLSADQNDKGFSVEVKAPGFLNFKIDKELWSAQLGSILKEKEKYGGSPINKGKKARVEYVSANPTGPIHIGNARGGPYGETICKVLEATGYKVLREYIHNDVGGQVEKLGRTIWYWYQKARGVELEFPEDGYKGQYPQEIAETAPKGLNSEQLTQFAVDYIFKENLETIDRLGIKFDLIVKESELQSSGKVVASVAELENKGFTGKKDGALWFVHPDLSLDPSPSPGEGKQDREAVIIKSDGQPTYFASDIAYHKEKFTSKYDLVIDIFGSNHHGHVPKLQALVKIFNPKQDFKVLLYQYVRVKMGNKVVKMAKRAGNFVTAKEVLDLVGKDSMIFFLLSTAVNTHMDFDLELARDTSEKNPVYKVQYAHARINSILEKAKQTSTSLPNPPHEGEGIGEEELGLVRELAKFPEAVAEISETYNAHHLPHYLLGLADKFHGFYEKVKVITDNENETAARLALVKAAKIVLANGLRLMGIEPMEKM